MPSDPPVCLTVSEQQGVAVRKDGLRFDSTKADKRSTRDDPTAMRGSSSVKKATKCSVPESSGSPGPALKDQFFLMGLPPPVVKADPNEKVQTLDHDMQIRRSQVNTYSAGIKNSPPAGNAIPNGSIPLVLCVSQEGSSTSRDGIAGRVITQCRCWEKKYQF